MKHVSIPLSDPQQAFVDAQVAEGKYPDAEACVAAVQAAASEYKLEAMLLEGLESPGAPWTAGSMDEIRSAERARL